MHRRILAALIFGAALISSIPAQALQCVPFARQISGIGLKGDAWTWWSAADGLYERGQAPRHGAVVVFKKFGSMRHGHVAVVTQVVNSREVLVDHANWGSRRTGGRGQIAKNMSVVDISPHNDWSQVRVWNRRSDDYGTRTYPTYGFIYPQGSRAGYVQVAAFIPEPPVTATRPMVQNIAPVPVEPTPVTAPLPDKAVPQKIEEAKLVEPKAVEAKPVVVEAKPVMVELAADNDQTLAARFGSGHY